MPAPVPSRGSAVTYRPAHPAGLPIFRHDRADHSAYYAPGVLCVVSRQEAEEFESAFAAPQEPGPEGQWAGELWRQARLAVAQMDQAQQEPFEPECLTLYLNDECNLRCTYCYAGPPRKSGAQIAPQAIAAAAGVVAKNCREKGLPLYLVVHGGGEPVLNRDRLQGVLDVLNAIAAAHQVDTFRYVATNGVMPEEKAAWLAHRFDLIGLSCDGPADVHDRQRPRWDGRPTLCDVERTARVLHREGARFHVRATITAETLDRQAEIADYLCRQFVPAEIHLEPVYLGGRAGTGFEPDRAEEFAYHFLEARLVALQYGIPLEISGSRLGSIHGPYCNVFRQVLNLVPGDRRKASDDGDPSSSATALATACFKTSRAGTVRQRGVAVGHYDPVAGRFAIEQQSVEALRQQLAAVPPECAACFNRYHCTGDCPDSCRLDTVACQTEVPEPGFRCRAQKAVTAGILGEMANKLWHEVVTGEIRGPHGTTIP